MRSRATLVDRALSVRAKTLQFERMSVARLHSGHLLSSGSAYVTRH